MKFSSILGNSQKLDGGAMFGNAPRALWTRWCPADELNRIDLKCRALLVETENHKILFETGIGSYMDPHLKSRYGVVEDGHVLLDSLKSLGLTHDDIDAVVISHLHFDHAGGLLTPFEEGKDNQLLFPNATYYVGERAWKRANDPHPRDRASFIPQLHQLLQASGRLNVLTEEHELHFDDLCVHFFTSDGHTPGMMCSDLRWGEHRMVFAADLIPGTPWVHLPITMGYDRYPEQLINEKKFLLEQLIEDGGWLFFTHDAETAMAKVALNGKKFAPVEKHEQIQRHSF